MPYDRKIFFDEVRASLFAGVLTQQQVDGMNFKLLVWEARPFSDDHRHLAYPFATVKLETGSKMWPVEEGGKGKGKEYGKPHPITGKTYYGRGDVQLTWYENYLKATRELDLKDDDDLTLYPERMLDPTISASVMYIGMWQGWFRGDKNGRQTLERYFDSDTNDAFNAREIINGDKNIVPKWDTKKRKIGTLIAEYHEKFLTALNDSWREPVMPPPDGEHETTEPQVVEIIVPEGIEVIITRR
jgi:putative chitinase